LLNQILLFEAMLLLCLGAAIAFARGAILLEARKNLWTAVGAAGLIASTWCLLLFVRG
jgi:hypothetical protein